MHEHIVKLTEKFKIRLEWDGQKMGVFFDFDHIDLDVVEMGDVMLKLQYGQEMFAGNPFGKMLCDKLLEGMLQVTGAQIIERVMR